MCKTKLFPFVMALRSANSNQVTWLFPLSSCTTAVFIPSCCDLTRFSVFNKSFPGSCRGLCEFGANLTHHHDLLLLGFKPMTEPVIISFLAIYYYHLTLFAHYLLIKCVPGALAPWSSLLCCLVICQGNDNEKCAMLS